MQNVSEPGRYQPDADDHIMICYGAEIPIVRTSWL